MHSLRPKSPALAVGTAWLTGTLGAAVLLMLPALLARLSTDLSFTETQLGVFSLADLGGLTLGAGVASYLISRYGVRTTLRGGLILAALANFACAPVTSYAVLLPLRLFAGLGAGLVVASAYVMLGRAAQVDRSFAIFLLCQGGFSAISLKSVPAVTEIIGLAGVFIALGTLYLSALAITSAAPTARESVDGSAQPARIHASIYTALLGILVFFVAQGGVWAYLELIGVRGGIDAAAVSNGLALSTLIGLSGPTTAALLGERLGRLLPLCLGLCVAWIALCLLGSAVNASQFTVGACLFNIAWNFSVPYQLAALSGTAASEAALAAAASTSLAGLAIGPLIASLVFHSHGFAGVLWLCAALYATSVIAFGPALLRRRVI